MNTNAIRAAASAALLIFTSVPARANEVRFVGQNARGQFGCGDTNSRAAFTKPTFAVPDSIRSVAMGNDHTILLSYDGTVYACGDNSYGQLGVGSGTLALYSFQKIPSLSHVKAIACGLHYSLFLLDDGRVFGCGRNDAGQLAQGNYTSPKYTPVLVVAADVVGIRCGGAHSAFLMSDGGVDVCGNNGSGQLGQADFSNRNTVQPLLGSGVIDVALGWDHTVVVRGGGQAQSCGSNSDGQLGVGDFANRNVLTLITSLTGVVSVTAGRKHSVFLSSDGEVHACGDNTYGQLGVFGAWDKETPIHSHPSAYVNRIVAGGDHTMCLTLDGTLVSYGRNNYVQLGTTNVPGGLPAFYKVTGMINVDRVACALYNTAILRPNLSIPLNDYNGDGRSDLAVFDPPTGAWYVEEAPYPSVLVWNAQWGWPGAITVPGDYDGDGFADRAVFDGNTGLWYIQSSTGAVLKWAFNWGWAGARPVPGDFNGDGISDLAVFDTATGHWFIRKARGGILVWDKEWGWPGATPVGGAH